MILPIYAHRRPLEPEALYVDTTELKVHLHDNSEDHIYCPQASITQYGARYMHCCKDYSYNTHTAMMG